MAKTCCKSHLSLSSVDDPEPTEWMADHPGWVKFPAVLIPRDAPKPFAGDGRPNDLAAHSSAQLVLGAQEEFGRPAELPDHHGPPQTFGLRGGEDVLMAFPRPTPGYLPSGVGSGSSAMSQLAEPIAATTTSAVPNSPRPLPKSGEASSYSDKFVRQPTASGEKYSHQGYAARPTTMNFPIKFVRVLLVLAITLPPGRIFADVPSFVLQALAGETPNLEILSPTGDARSPLRWATWMTGVQQTSNVVWLGLLRRDAKVPARVWGESHKGGYNPEVRLMYNWQYGGSPILMFTYQMGAIDKELELFGLTDSQGPILLGQYSAEDFFIRYRDEVFLEAYGGLDTPTLCIFFPAEQKKPRSGHCPS